jgi:regulator of RNase E activity RraA
LTHTQDITRPPRQVVDALARIGSATLAGELFQLGIRRVNIRGPVSQKRGRVAAGPALTLQFMPKREDQFGAAEYDDPEKQLHRHVMYHTQAGDMIVVDARGDMDSGIFGEMMLTYFTGKGGVGVVIDGCIRDAGPALALDVGIWVRGFTPNFHAQTNIIPWGVNVPIACGDALVLPGDIVVADDDGAVVVPISMTSALLERAGEHSDWEEFARLRLAAGGDMRKYYPLREDAQAEYEAWRKAAAPTGKA